MRLKILSHFFLHILIFKFAQQVHGQLLNEIEAHSLTRVQLAQVQNELTRVNLELKATQEKLEELEKLYAHKEAVIRTLEEDLKKQAATAQLSNLQDQLSGLKTEVDQAHQSHKEEEIRAEKGQKKMKEIVFGWIQFDFNIF